MRVVSLVPSVTETLLAWGVEPVACTRFCEQPDLPHVGGTKDPDIAAICALAPDLVVVDREENRREDAEALIAAGLQVHVAHVVSVDDVPAMLDELAGVVGVSSSSAHDVGGIDPPVWASALTLIWRRPWMTINDATYGSSLLRRIGVANVVGDACETYPTLDLPGLDLAPTFVVLPSEPYPFAARHLDEITRLLPGVAPILLDGRDLFWWGVRTAAALDRLRAPESWARPHPTHHTRVRGDRPSRSCVPEC